MENSLKKITQINDFEADVQAKIKTKCSCCNNSIFRTVNFRLEIQKSDDYGDHRQQNSDYPHFLWNVYFRSDVELSKIPVHGQNADLIQAYNEARENLQQFINENK